MLQPTIGTLLFFSAILAPVAESWQPGFLRDVLSKADQIWILAPHVWAYVIAAGEILGAWALAFGLPFLRRIAGLGLIAWSLVVWVVGEGMGNLFNGIGSILTGTPGAALLYALVTALCLFPESHWRQGYIGFRIRQAMGRLWIMMAGLQALPGAGFWQGPRLADAFGLMTMEGPEPFWEQRIINWMVSASFRHPVSVNLAWVVLSLIVG